jgi:hypothetical protein
MSRTLGPGTDGGTQGGHLVRTGAPGDRCE